MEKRKKPRKIIFFFFDYYYDDTRTTNKQTNNGNYQLPRERDALPLCMCNCVYKRWLIVLTIFVLVVCFAQSEGDVKSRSPRCSSMMMWWWCWWGERNERRGELNKHTNRKRNKNKIVKEVVAGEYANNVAGHTAQSRRRRKEKKIEKNPWRAACESLWFVCCLFKWNDTVLPSRPKTSLLPFLFLLLFYAELRLAVWVVVDAAKYMRPGPDDYSPALCFLGAKGVPPGT